MPLKPLLSPSPLNPLFVVVVARRRDLKLPAVWFPTDSTLLFHTFPYSSPLFFQRLSSEHRHRRDENPPQEPLQRFARTHAHTHWLHICSSAGGTLVWVACGNRSDSGGFRQVDDAIVRYYVRYARSGTIHCARSHTQHEILIPGKYSWRHFPMLCHYSFICQCYNVMRQKHVFRISAAATYTRTSTLTERSRNSINKQQT